MIDREKVIKGLECMAFEDNVCRSDCPYFNPKQLCVEMMAREALALLKEQVPISPTVNENHEYVFEIYKCGACGGFINHRARYCEHCGRAVKWDA